MSICHDKHKFMVFCKATRITMASTHITLDVVHRIYTMLYKLLKNSPKLFINKILVIHQSFSTTKVFHSIVHESTLLNVGANRCTRVYILLFTALVYGVHIWKVCMQAFMYTT